MNKKANRLLSFSVAFAMLLGSFYSVSAASNNAVQALGTTYYVSVSGNDTKGCTSAAPCKTFKKAISLAQTGDVIQLAAGTYSQQLIASKSGITILGNGAVIDGANTGTSPCVQISGNNVLLDKVVVKNCHTHGIFVFGANDTVQNSTVTNSLLENYPPLETNSWGSAFKSSQGASNVTFLNNVAIGNFGEGFGITRTLGATLKGNISIDNYSVNYYPDNSSDVVLDGNFAGCSGNPILNRAGKRPTGISLGEEVYAGWTTHPHNIEIVRNTISGCGSGIIFWGADVANGGLDTVTIQNNTIYGGTGAALSLAYESANKNVNVDHNIFYSAPAPWVENTSGITLQDNFWIGSLPGSGARGANDKAGDPSFAVTPVWNNADSFHLKIDSAACGYGSWSCDDTTQTVFADVPATHWAYPWILQIYQAGITSGCGTSPLTYCPEKSVTRAEMAVFLERSMNGSKYAPPDVTTQFADTVNYWAQDWIDNFANDGIASGCGSGNFCPATPVTRAQMAIFLLRAKYGPDYAPPAANGAMFGDVPTSYWAAAWIEQLAVEGITGGCGGGNYCPEGSVTRAQLAAFLVRAFNFQ